MKKTRFFYLSLITALGLTVGGAVITTKSYYDGGVFGVVNDTYQPNISFDATTNKIYQGTGSSGSSSYTSMVKTGLGNDVRLQYKYVSNDGWQGIEEYGYIRNIDPITSIKSITMNFSKNTNVGIILYYSIFPDFRDNKALEFNRAQTTTFNFEDREAHYFKLTTYEYRHPEDCILIIESMNIDFYCDENHHYLDVSTYTPELGSVSQSGYYMAGREIKVQAIPNVGVKFDGWFKAGDTEPLSLNEEYQFTMPNNDYYLIARFKDLKIKLGSYPQSQVWDQNLIDHLTSKIDHNKWISYNNYYYYGEGPKDNINHYQDINYNMEKYRSVREGGDINKISFFKFEPIVWYPLGNDGLYLSLYALDATQTFYHSKKSRTINGETINPNNYEHSYMRNFLNNNFYNFAFNKDEEGKIIPTLIKNDLDSTLDDKNNYTCNDTVDKVFLLSNKDVNNPNYGFTCDADRKLKSSWATSYAKKMNIYYYYNVEWALRSPDKMTHYSYGFVSEFGFVQYAHCPAKDVGIRPAIYYRA